MLYNMLENDRILFKHLEYLPIVTFSVSAQLIKKTRDKLNGDGS
jgi:hypothetical protein